MPEIYVYYRIDLADEDAFETQLRAMQARLACSTGITGRLIKSCSDNAMRMEVYCGINVRESFIAALEQSVRQFEVDMFLADGERRHLECFME